MTAGLTLDQRLEALKPVLEEYVTYTRKVIPQFEQDPSTNNEIREAILGQTGLPMLAESPGAVRHQLGVVERNLGLKLEGKIDANDPLHEHTPTPLADPKALIDKALYNDVRDEHMLSDDGKRAYYLDMLSNQAIAGELKKALDADKTDTFKKFRGELGFAQILRQYVNSGRTAQAIKFIKDNKNDANVSSLVRDLQLFGSYGAPGSVEAVVNQVADAAEQRAINMYKDVKGNLQKAVETAIEKTGAKGYLEGFLLHNTVYESDPEKTYRKDLDEMKKSGVTDLNVYRKQKAEKEAAAKKAGQTA